MKIALLTAILISKALEYFEVLPNDGLSFVFIVATSIYMTSYLIAAGMADGKAENGNRK